ncbi:hypothetical protein KZE55_04325 [Limosilactobacillus panis]|nr:hypothetical protein KZE55_04325 [Limosilactobacillus panis]
MAKIVTASRSFICRFNLAYAMIHKKGASRMGLVTRRSEQLDRLFDQFAIDPKKKLPKDKKSKEDQEKENKVEKK